MQLRTTTPMGLLALCLLLLACGDTERDRPAGTGGTAGTGGSGGSGGGGGSQAREQLCDALCEPLVACGLAGGSHDACVATCVADEATGDEALAACAACAEAASCTAFTACLSSCAPADHDLAVELPAGDGATGELFVAVFDGPTGELLQHGSAPIADGAPTRIDLQGALSSARAATVAAFLDLDDDGACDPTDTAWRIEMPPAADDVVLTLDEAEAGGPDEVCGQFTDTPRHLRIEGSGFAAPAGAVALVTATDDFEEEMDPQLEAAVVDGAFRIQLDRFLAPETSTDLAWMVDLDGDGRCHPTRDAGGTAQVEGPYPTHRTLPVTQAAASDAPCERFVGMGYDLRLVGSAFEPFEGQEIRAVIQDAAGARRSFGMAPIEDGAFSLLVRHGVIPGMEQRVALFVDEDGDERCTAADAAWWVVIPAGDGHIEQNFARPDATDVDACDAHPPGTWD
ncbi:hypothetical protein [Vulgatibacter sp.]|uniref:hypothetical protein n=1 Tax=Vulgatibacter sp. TaxID=1971226 RepID=UPI0035673888